MERNKIEDSEDRDILMVLLKSFGAGIIALLIMILTCLLSGCKSTQYMPVETVRTEYKDRIQEAHTVDSISDIRFVYVKGDTVIDWRDRVRWRDREVHDSIYIEKVDTIRVPYPVERNLNRWQKAKLDFGGIAIIILLFIGLFVVVFLLQFCCSKNN